MFFLLLSGCAYRRQLQLRF